MKRLFLLTASLLFIGTSYITMLILLLPFPSVKKYVRLFKKFQLQQERSFFIFFQGDNYINKKNLTSFAIKRMRSHVLPSTVAISGIAVCITIILTVFSAVYGLERLVTERSMSMNEITMITATPKANTTQYSKDEITALIQRIPQVKQVFALQTFIASFKNDLGEIETVGYLTDRSFDTFVSSRNVSGNVLSAQNFEASSGIEIVINRTLAKKLGIDEKTANGTALNGTIEAVSENGYVNSFSGNQQRFYVTGILDEDENNAYFYMTTDATSPEIMPRTSYEQIIIFADSYGAVGEVAKEVERLGFTTNSVLETSRDITYFFSIIKLATGIFGILALSVAFFGVFYSLSISLIDRTNEIGTMKIIGMRDSEIEDLFITESFLLTITGAIIGVIVSYILVFSGNSLYAALASAYGYDPVQILYIPFYLVISICVIACFVGTYSGIFPAKRAARIPALDSIRYE